MDKGRSYMWVGVGGIWEISLQNSSQFCCELKPAIKKLSENINTYINQLKSHNIYCMII